MEQSPLSTPSALRTIVQRGGLVVSAILVTLAALATPARADNPLPVYQGNGLEGADPVATGCSHDAYTVDSAPIIGHDLSASTGQELNLVYGIIALRYSPSCQTNWATAYLNAPMGGHGFRIAVASQTYPAVVRIEGGNNQTYHFYAWAPSTAQYSGVIYSDMVYSPTIPHDPGVDAPNCARAEFSIVLYSQYNTVDLNDFEQFGWSSPDLGAGVTGCF
jgi:hypothetical protein